MNRLITVFFPTLSGRVDAALRIRGMEAQIRRLTHENAALRLKADQLDQIRRAARARVAERTRGI